MSGELVYTAGEFDSAVLDLTVDAPAAVTTKRAILRGVYVNSTMSAHEVVLSSGGVNRMRIPASAAAGSFFPAGDMKMLGGITATKNASATGELLVIYKEIP